MYIKFRLIISIFNNSVIISKIITTTMNHNTAKRIKTQNSSSDFWWVGVSGEMLGDRGGGGSSGRRGREYIGTGYWLPMKY